MKADDPIQWKSLGMIYVVHYQSSPVARWLEALRVAAGVSVWRQVGIRIMVTDSVGHLLELAMEDNFELEDQAVHSIRILQEVQLVPWRIRTPESSPITTLRQDLWEWINPVEIPDRIKPYHWIQKWT